MVECEPLKINKSEVQVVVPLQDLLNKTVERLSNAVAREWNKEVLLNLEILVTTGFDSSSGHINPHQKCENVMMSVLRLRNLCS